MSTSLEQAQLASQFADLLEKERQAERACAELAAKTGDPQLKQQIEQLRLEKLRHIELTGRLIEIVG